MRSSDGQRKTDDSFRGNRHFSCLQLWCASTLYHRETRVFLQKIALSHNLSRLVYLLGRNFSRSRASSSANDGALQRRMVPSSTLEIRASPRGVNPTVTTSRP